jgi:Cu(I)/Ag(I) efflux system membrane fusion protein
MKLAFPALPQSPTRPHRHYFRTALGIALIRLRFVLLLFGLLVLVGTWPTLRNYWDKFFHPSVIAPSAVSADTEYWCPMCPGVLSAWPSKCPVCNMALVRRHKSEAVALPNGVVARMQLTPYRVQLAGIRTVTVSHQPLVEELSCTGVVESESKTSRPRVEVDVAERDLALFTVGSKVQVASDAYPGMQFAGMVLDIGTRATGGKLRVRIDVDAANAELRANMTVRVHARTPVARLSWYRKPREEWRNGVAVDVAAFAAGVMTGPMPVAGLAAFCQAGVDFALHEHELVLAVPESAVIDTGGRRVVFLDRGNGMFDAIEVILGHRSGSYYPVLAGLTAGQRVVAVGAFLLDAQTRLDPNAGIAYFGARTASEAAPSTPADSDDTALIARQKICPVTGKPLGSMGTPVAVVAEGRKVFVCCAGCTDALVQNPGKYRVRIPAADPSRP